MAPPWRAPQHMFANSDAPSDAEGMVGDQAAQATSAEWGFLTPRPLFQRYLEDRERGHYNMMEAPSRIPGLTREMFLEITDNFDTMQNIMSAPDSTHDGHLPYDFPNPLPAHVTIDPPAHEAIRAHFASVVQDDARSESRSRSRS